MYFFLWYWSLVQTTTRDMALSPIETGLIIVLVIVVVMWLLNSTRGRSVCSSLKGRVGAALRGRSGASSTTSAQAPLSMVVPTPASQPAPTLSGKGGPLGAHEYNPISAVYEGAYTVDPNKTSAVTSSLDTIPVGPGAHAGASDGASPESLIVPHEENGFYQSPIVPPQTNPDTLMRIDTSGAIYGLLRGETDVPTREECMRICTDRDTQFQNSRRYEQCGCRELLGQG
jgi:hypothetical protein